MSLTKKYQEFPKKINDETVAKAVANALRQAHENTPSSIKKIGRVTGANLRTVGNWYRGQNAPKSTHLLLLAKHYPAVLQALLTLLDLDAFWRLYQQQKSTGEKMLSTPESPDALTIYTSKFVPINVSLDPEISVSLNQRQLWFLGQLQQGLPKKADDIAQVWSVTSKTAKRDVAGLVRAGLVKFLGANRNGVYMVEQ